MVAIYFTKSHPEGELPPSSPSALLEKEICGWFCSAQLVFASQNLHFEKKMHEYDLGVYETNTVLQEELGTDGPALAWRLGPSPHYAPRDSVSF